jgi:diguanylate cyclase (GGDEF)-like protein
MELVTSRLSDRHTASGGPQSSKPSSLILLIAALAATFALDRATDAAPVQHLYYVPIVFAALRFGSRGGSFVATIAIVLYHMANKRGIARHYGESDIIQILLFVAAGLISAKLFRDARRLKVLATTDDLTGLHNLRSFEENFSKMHNTNTPLSLLVLDLDHLKDLNDSCGHLCGAEAVRTVGHIIAAQIPADAVACRYGGDEFAVLLPTCSIATAEEVASSIRAAVHAVAPRLGGRLMPAGLLSVSVGVAGRPARKPGASTEREAERFEAEALFRAADRALYSAKGGGRNRVSIAQLVGSTTA